MSNDDEPANKNGSTRPINFAAEARKQKRLDRLETANPQCVHCGESDDRCLEDHHIAGRRFDPATMVLCRNCHRKLSDMQRDHRKPIGNAPSLEECVAHFLLGLADLFELLIRKFREFAGILLENQKSATGSEVF